MPELRSLAWRVSWYRHSELEGSLLLGRVVRHATDAYLVRELTRHAAEEARHAWVWTRAIDAAGLPTLRIYRSYQSFYRDELAPPRTLLDVLALTHVFEQRVERHFTDELTRSGVPQPIRRAFALMLHDEQHHLHWVGQWLARHADAAIVLTAIAPRTNVWSNAWRHFASGSGTSPVLVRSVAVMSESSPSPRYNLTRRSRSIPVKLLRQRSPHLVLLYYLLRLSDLGREAIEHSGSHRFADHIYCGVPSGRNALGRWLDRRLLAMPAARAFPAAASMRRRQCDAHSSAGPLDGYESLVCLAGFLATSSNSPVTLAAEDRALLARIEYDGLDIDPDVLMTARRLTRECGLAADRYHRGNALDPNDYPSGQFDLIVSTGLGEFLDDGALAAFYRIVFDTLEPGGVFYTSATSRDSKSDVLLRMVELDTHYRNVDALRSILSTLPWTHVELTVDGSRLQTFVTAMK